MIITFHLFAIIMNLLLLAAEAIDAEGIAVVSGRQANHAIEVLNAKV